MQIDKVTVRSYPNSKHGATPIGSGLIFLSDHMSAFEHTFPFHKFTTKAEYNEWKQNRLKNPSPLMPHEPAAFFEFEGGAGNTDTSITVEVDFKRACKYIFLKPTAFRKTTAAN